MKSVEDRVCYTDTLKYGIDTSNYDVIKGWLIRIPSSRYYILINGTVYDVTKWKGQNLRGFALMEVRKVLSNTP